ncbi:MAG: hypothetical protein LC737_05435, partial [Chloroflexi bacterium]|nr:hypothetical protein [Chloroflexota bacterium]
ETDMPATLRPLDSLVRERRRVLALDAVRIYAETKSLRKTAERMNVSHETVRALLTEAQRETA